MWRTSRLQLRILCSQKEAKAQFDPSITGARQWRRALPPFQINASQTDSDEAGTTVRSLLGANRQL